MEKTLAWAESEVEGFIHRLRSRRCAGRRSDGSAAARGSGRIRRVMAPAAALFTVVREGR
jgi:hypothetical protein